MIQDGVCTVVVYTAKRTIKRVAVKDKKLWYCVIVKEVIIIVVKDKAAIYRHYGDSPPKGVFAFVFRYILVLRLLRIFLVL